MFGEDAPKQNNRILYGVLMIVAVLMAGLIAYFFYTNRFSEFEKDNYVTGEKLSGKGKVYSKELILVVSKKDWSGNESRISVSVDASLPPEGTEVSFEGLVAGGVMSGEQPHYLPNGVIESVTRFKIISLKNCHIQVLGH